MTKDKKDPRRGGLGRGLAALIPTAPESNPSVGDGAADIIFGPRGNRHSDDNAMTGDRSAKRHSDDTVRGGATTTSGRDRARDAQQPGGGDSVAGAGSAANVSRETSAGSDGRGASATDSKNEGSVESAATVTGAADGTGIGATYREIEIPLIIPNPRQPREVFEEEPLRELAHSIREFGLMQPIVVRQIPEQDRAKALEVAREKDGSAGQPEYEIIMGERRWRASQLAGLDSIPAIVRETSDDSMLRDALLENIHRVQLNPLEEAAAYQQLLEEFDVTQAQLAERIGRSRPVITNMIRLLQLPVAVQRRVAAGVLTAGHARALLGIKTGAGDQEHLADRIVAEGLSVRATEEAVTLINRGDDAEGRKKRELLPQPEQLSVWADRLADSFDTKVTATMGKRKGRIVIEFGDLEDFDRIMSLIENDGD